MGEAKQIETLVEDIYRILDEGLPENYDAERIQNFGLQLSNIISSRLDGGKSHTPALRMSNIGQPCERKLWYSINEHEKAEALPPATRMKFLFGDILESLLLFLAEASGHTVEGMQDVSEIEGILGHKDAIIDGTIVDSKSASTFSFKKFKDHELEGNDSFGYIDQLGSYLHAGQDDPKVLDKDRAAFLVVDKQHGHICLDIHKKREIDYNALFRYKKSVVNNKDEVPERDFEPVKDGESGNMKLPMICSYCDYKQYCHPGLRTFLYSNGPRFLTTVAKRPQEHIREVHGPVETDD